MHSNLIQVTDQLGRNTMIPKFPKRIVSLVPSQTELLFDLGLDDRIHGITKFCIHPTHWYKSKIRVGGTKNINFDKIDAIQPDLIIVNKEENEEQQLKQLMKKYPVWVSDISSLSEALDMIKSVGEITNTRLKSEEIIQKIKTNFNQLIQLSLSIKVLYLIWKNPYMAAGNDTFINDMMKKCGLENGITKNRYPIVTEKEIKLLSPDYVFLSSEPYPFKQKHIEELQDIIPNSKITLVDGEYFSWYGSRLINAVNYFNEVISKL